MATHKWTEWLKRERLEKIRTLREAVDTDAELAERMGVTLNALNAARKRYPAVDDAVTGGKPREAARARIWPDSGAFLRSLNEYVEYCRENGRLCNVAGFCVYAGTDTSVFYASKEYYPDAFARAHAILEDEALNCKTAHNKIVALYLKNKCGYTDKVETDNVNINAEVGMTPEDKALLQRLEEKLKQPKPSDKA